MNLNVDLGFRKLGYDMMVYISGQIIATSAEVTLNGGLVRESHPKSPKHSGLGIIRQFAQHIWLCYDTIWFDLIWYDMTKDMRRCDKIQLMGSEIRLTKWYGVNKFVHRGFIHTRWLAVVLSTVFSCFFSRKLGKDCRLRTDIFRKKAVATAIDGIVLAQNDPIPPKKKPGIEKNKAGRIELWMGGS